ncbi:MAG: UDP-N-acetylmuramate dehydrogenase, partial [Propioniciclava sp.]
MTELLARHTTLRVGGPARTWIEAATGDELVAVVAEADAAAEQTLILAGGSNVVIADAGFPGTVVHVGSRGIISREEFCQTDLAACGGVLVEVQAGEPWDRFVGWTVAQELTGVEALSGIPGAVGSTPIQNVGAYGQEISQTLWNVRTWDRQERRYRTFPNVDCRFGYRTSRFKAEPGRFIVVSVTFQLRQGDTSEPIRYAQLAERLGVVVG